MPTTAVRHRGRWSPALLVSCLVITGAYIASPARAAHGTPITGVNVAREGGAVLVNVEAPDQLAYSATTLEAPKRYVVTLPGARLVGDRPARYEVDYGAVRAVGLEAISGPEGGVRVVVSLAGAAECEARPLVPGGLAVVVRPPTDRALTDRARGAVLALAAPESDAGRKLVDALLGGSRVARPGAAHEPPVTLATLGTPQEAVVALTSLGSTAPELYTRARTPALSALATSELALRAGLPEPIARLGPSRPPAVGTPSPAVPPVPVAIAQSPWPLPGTVAPAATSGQAEPPRAGAPDVIDLQFVNAEIGEILSALGKYSGKNIVVSDSVQGTLTLDLHQVTLTDALDLVTKLHGYDYLLLDERTYVVGTSDELLALRPDAVRPGAITHTYRPQNTTPRRIQERFEELFADTGVTAVAATDLNFVIFRNIKDVAQREWLVQMLPELDVKPPTTSELVTLQYVAPDQAATTLEQMVPDLKATVPEGIRNDLIRLEGTADAIAAAKAALALIDVEPTGPAPGAVRKAVLYQCDYVNGEDLVGVLQARFTQGLTVTPVEGQAAGRTKLSIEGLDEYGSVQQTTRLILEGDEATVEQALELCALLDVPPHQVQITAVVAELRLTRNASRGFVWDLPGLVFSEDSPSDGWKFGRLTRSPLTFSSVFDAIEERSDAKILAQPKVVAANERRGHILVGSVIPYEVAVAGAGTVTRSVQFQEIGLSLDFVPIVHSDNTVEVFLEPKVSTFTGFTPQGYPEVSTREAGSVLHLSDGDTFVLGGLFQDEMIVTKSGIPFLKDWPIIGELFRSRSKSRQRTEIVFLAKLEIIRRGSPAEDAGGTPGGAAGGEG